MRYHLKEDGTAGPCKAAPGNCPKGAAIHGDSVQEVYSQLESVMKSQLFPEPEYPAPKERPSAREIGSAGQMMTYNEPEIIKLQLEAFAKLGIISDAIPILEKHSPVIGKAWEVGTQGALEYANFKVKQQEYIYEGSNDERFIGQTPTWVANSHYELQTAALNSLMDKLETGTLEGVDLDAYQVALGDTHVLNEYGKPQVNAFLAFNYNPHRQDDNFFNNVKTRFLKEGFGKTQLSENKSRFKVPAFYWNGLDETRKERVVAQLLSDNYDGRGGKREFKDKALGRDFGKLLSTTFAYNSQLNVRGIEEGTPASFSLDWDGSKVEGTYKFTDDGFEWTETSRTYVTPKPDPRLAY